MTTPTHTQSRKFKVDPMAYSIPQAARLLATSASTVRRLVDGGKIQMANLLPREQRNGVQRISAIELQRYFRECGGGDLFPPDALALPTIQDHTPDIEAGAATPSAA